MALDKIITDYVLNLKTFKKQTKEIEKDLEKVEKEAKDSTKNVSKKIDGFGSSVKKIGGMIGVAFAAEKLVQFGTELVEVRKKAEGVERAFSRIPNSQKLLRDLKRETKGVVSELQLMQSAVKAKQFNIPLENLGRLLKFAQVRARETGESVDFLVDSIINGISRKSLPILDNLGLSMNEIRSEMKSTGDMSSAVFTIVNRELEMAGEGALLLADQVDKNTANWENFKRTLSQAVGPAAQTVSNIFGQLIERLDEMAKQTREADATVQGQGFIRSIQEQAQSLNDSKQIQEMQDAYFEMLQVVAGEATGSPEDAIFIKKVNKAINILQARLNQLNSEIEENSIRSISKLKKEISELQKEIDETPGSGKKFESLINQLSVKQKQLNDIMFRYNALLNIRKNLEEEIADESPLDEEIDKIIARDEAALDSAEKRKNAESDLAEHIEKLREKQAERDAEFDKEQEERNVQFLESASGRYAEISEAALSSFAQITDNITQIQLNNLQRQLESGQITQEQFERRRIELLREQAVKDKAFKIFEAITNTAVAVTAELKKGPAAAALAGVLGAAQIAAIISQPLPQFAKGVIGLQGPGTGTSDSIPAMLSAGESVMTAQETADNYDALMAMRKKNFDEYINQNHVLPILAQSAEIDAQQAAQLMAVGNALKGDNIPLIHAIQSNANKRNRNSDKNAEYIAKEVGRTIIREGYFRNRYS